MIETREQFIATLQYLREWWDEDITVELEATIEALREVARAAEAALNAMETHQPQYNEETIELARVLDELPDWLTEADDGRATPEPDPVEPDWIDIGD